VHEKLQRDTAISAIAALTHDEKDVVAFSVSTMIELGLIQEEDGYLYSRRVNANLLDRKALTEKRRLAAATSRTPAKAAKKRTQKASAKQVLANAQQMLSSASKSSASALTYTDNTNVLSTEDSIESSTVVVATSRQQPRNQRQPVSREEFMAYAENMGMDIAEATNCFLYYEANGWVQGRGKPLKSWQATVELWHRKSARPPTADEARIELVEKRGWAEQDAVAFYAHYSATGWKDKNGNPITNWLAKAKTWQRNSSR